MSAIAEAPAPEATPEAEVETTDQAVQPTRSLFRYSKWIHVGGTDETNQAVEAGEASPEDEFHAWVRLPNQFQHRAIRDRAMAAKARARRQLRDTESEAHLILEDDLAELAMDPECNEKCVNELLSTDWPTHFQQALRDAKAFEIYVEPTPDEPEPDPEKPFGLIEEDQRRFDEISALPEDERPADEYESLTRHLSAYNDKVQEILEDLQSPRKIELEQMDTDALINAVRIQRIERHSMNEFMHYYSSWQWVAGTFDRPKGKPLFHDPKEFSELDEDVIDALRGVFNDLESARGNS